jgi:uncharacterized protein
MIKQLVESIVKMLVSKPDAVQIIETTQGNGVALVGIKVAEPDLGKVIGKNGKTIKAIRALVFAVNPTEKDVLVDIAS